MVIDAVECNVLHTAVAVTETSVQEKRNSLASPCSAPSQHETNYAMGWSKDSFCNVPTNRITCTRFCRIEFLTWHNLNCIFVTHHRPGDCDASAFYVKLQCSVFISRYIMYILRSRKPEPVMDVDYFKH